MSAVPHGRTQAHGPSLLLPPSLWRRPRSRLTAGLLRGLLGGALCALVGCREKATPITPPAMSGALAQVAGNLPIDGEIAAQQAALRGPAAGDADAWAALARTFVRKARQASDPRYYGQAQDAAERALRLTPGHAGATQVRLVVLQNQHRFAEAQTLATTRVAQAPRDAIAWGALGDSALELGDYDAAMAAYQAMIDIKPDLRSYSRGAWMRFLTGDSDGAVDLMRQAIDAGTPREPESRAYCRVQLADLHFARGEYDAAAAVLDLALRDLPGYAAAHAARGRLRLHAGDGPAATADALADLAAALRIQPLITTRILYVQALEQAGRRADADAELATLLREGPREDPRALSLFLSSRRQQVDLAQRLAQEEWARRPDIWSADALAWALFRGGQVDAAWQAAQRASRLGTRDPAILFHVGAIALGRGDLDRARAALQSALTTSPRWHRADAAEARQLLAKLSGAHSPATGSVK